MDSPAEKDRAKQAASRRRRRRWIFWVCLILAAWLFLGWGLPFIVDKRHLRNAVIDWTQHSLAMTSPVSLGRTDLALRTNLRTDLYIHDLEFDPPNPAFDLPWLQVDTIRASDKVYRLWGGIQSDPVVQLRDLVLRVETDSSGECNVCGLRFSQQEKTLPLMNHLNFGTVTLELMNDYFILNTPECNLKFLLNGTISYQDGVAECRPLKVPVTIATRRDGMRSTLNAGIHLKTFRYDLGTKDLQASLKLNAFPLDVLQALIKNAPLPEGNILADLSVTADKGVVRFNGVLSGIEDRLLPGTCAVEGTLNFDGLALKTIVIQASTTGGLPVVAFACNRQEDGRWGRLEIGLQALDLGGIDGPRVMGQVRQFFSAFPSLRVTVNTLNFQGLVLGETVADILPASGNTVDISAEGKAGGGTFSLVAKGQSLDKWGAPQSLLCSLKAPDAGDLLRRFSAFLPRELQFSTTSGKGELTVGFEAAKKPAQENPTFLLNLQMQDLTIPTLTGGALIQELAGVRARMVELENLCRRAAVKPRESLVYNPSPFESLKLDYLKLSYAIIPGENGWLRGLLAKSPQIGEIEAVGREEDGDVFHLSVFISKIPSSFYQNLQKLSPGVLKALSSYLKSNKLKIEVNCAGKESSVVPQYVQDVFRYWGELQTKKGQNP